MFTESGLDSQSTYPQPGGIRCTSIESWRDGSGRHLVKVSTAHPDALESTEDLIEFVVLRDQVSLRV